MSLATLRPAGLPFASPLQTSTSSLSAVDIPFHHEPSYLQLKRMLTRYQNLILLIQSPTSDDPLASDDFSPLQRQIQAELYCPLPYHRTKWLHNVESARNLLLSLERQAQGIKTVRAKRDALEDLAEKRQAIKRLRNRIEEIGREVEGLGSKAWSSRREEDEDLLGERADEILRKASRDADKEASVGIKPDDTLQEGRPITQVSEDTVEKSQAEDHDREVLFGSSIRRRPGQGNATADQSTPTRKGTTSGFSNLPQTERSLQAQSREHEDLTSALVSMAAQLKQQSRAFQFSLSQDDNLLNRAIEGLDRNISGMEAASKNMAFLRRMSEEQGWLGRLKLYGIIFGMWVLAILLVFVGPKLRF